VNKNFAINHLIPTIGVRIALRRCRGGFRQKGLSEAPSSNSQGKHQMSQAMTFRTYQMCPCQRPWRLRVDAVRLVLHEIRKVRVMLDKRRQHQALTHLSDRLLDDIGVRREEVDKEIARPLWIWVADGR
jgi:uncharacterized protein YjiS (DUF1127 family)